MDKALNVTQPPNPFHAGELEAQARAGAGDVAAWAGGFIRDHMPAQHRDFYTSLPFLVMAGADTAGQTWVTLVDGAEGFITSPDTKSLSLDTLIAPADPLAAAFEAGTDIGVVGIELHSR
ncbi:MAG: ferredoxin, partial [Pseudomonadota bacterium]|nr:ferredoxin [Pseudomonadota bacterium]